MVSVEMSFSLKVATSGGFCGIAIYARHIAKLPLKTDSGGEPTRRLVSCSGAHRQRSSPTRFFVGSAFKGADSARVTRSVARSFVKSLLGA